LNEHHMMATGHELMTASTTNQSMFTRRISFCHGRFKKSFHPVLEILTSMRRLGSGNSMIQLEYKEKCFPIRTRIRSTLILCRTGRTSITLDNLSFLKLGEDLKTRFTTILLQLNVRTLEFRRDSLLSLQQRLRQDPLLSTLPWAQPLMNQRTHRLISPRFHPPHFQPQTSRP